LLVDDTVPVLIKEVDDHADLVVVVAEARPCCNPAFAFAFALRSGEANEANVECERCNSSVCVRMGLDQVLHSIDSLDRLLHFGAHSPSSNESIESINSPLTFV
jgi:hypothetical protein